MKYIQLDCHCADQRTETFIAYLADIGFEGFIETEHGFSAFIPETIYHTTGIEKEIEDMEDLYGLDLGIKTINEENWNKIWESNFSPIKVENKFGVRASFHPAFSDVEHEIVIDPKMSFGTGHHETTLLMLQMMMKQDFEEKKVLDYGCGTGILSIMASKLGANSVYAIDIDQWAFENTKENSELNKAENIVVAKGDQHNIPKEKYDIILANINKHVILDSLCTIHSRLNNHGILNISGFYMDDAREIIEKAEKIGLQNVQTEEHNDWCCVCLKS